MSQTLAQSCRGIATYCGLPSISTTGACWLGNRPNKSFPACPFTKILRSTVISSLRTPQFTSAVGEMRDLCRVYLPLRMGFDDICKTAESRSTYYRYIRRFQRRWYSNIQVVESLKSVLSDRVIHCTENISKFSQPS